MSLFRQLTRGLRSLVDPASADRDVDDELRHYLDAAAADAISRGVSPDRARRDARLEMGSLATAREEVRASGWEHAVETLAADVRHAARRLRQHPGFTIVSVLTLALGIGASTAIFGALNPILLEPLPYPHADRVTTIWDRGIDNSALEVTFGTYRELASRSRSFERMAVVQPWPFTLTGTAEPERLDGQRVSADYFRTLGVAPAIGRDFAASDDVVRGPNVAIIADTLWRRRFGADPALVGRSILLSGVPFTVIGVMPRAFENVVLPSAEIWAPLQYDTALPPQGREWGHHLRLVGRLRPGAALDRVQRELETIAQNPVAEFQRVAWASLQAGLVVMPLQADVTRGVKPALLAVVGAVVLVLAIACINVTNLLLARGAQRRDEFAMRAALGAGRGRIVRQLVTETIVLAIAGGACGLLVAQAGVRGLVALSLPGLPRVDAIRIDAAVFAFAFGITTLVGVMVGLVPALNASRIDLRAGAQSRAGRTAGHHVMRRTLVVAEVAFAIVLLVGAGLLLRSVRNLLAVDPGFDGSRVLTMQVQASGPPFADRAMLNRFFAQALDAVRAVPSVESAAFTSMLPLSGDFLKFGVWFDANPQDDPRTDRSAFRYAITDGYLETMRIPLRRGRGLDVRDTAGRLPAALISESLARRRFADGNPIGQRLTVGTTDQPWITVVGVVGDVRQASLTTTAEDAVYVMAEQAPVRENTRWLVVRARGDAAALAPAVRRAIWSVDKDQPIVRVGTMETLVARSAAERRFALILFEAFALAALILAALGIYGVLSGSVGERVREIGVRSALGASRNDILAMMGREGAMLVGVGVAIGLAGAAGASGTLDTLLFGVSRLDPLTYGGVLVLVVLVSAIACWRPAWRAAAVDPSVTLRAE